jgi:hypothetical protein
VDEPKSDEFGCRFVVHLRVLDLDRLLGTTSIMPVRCNDRKTNITLYLSQKA